MQQALFSIGQLIRHRLFGYRGVIYDVDPQFAGSEEWYRQMARTQPPRDRPWYKVLVDGGTLETYVAERNLSPDHSGLPVEHPRVAELFDGFQGGRYHLARHGN